MNMSEFMIYYDVFKYNLYGEEIAIRQLLVICDVYWFSTLRRKINAKENFVESGYDTCEKRTDKVYNFNVFASVNKKFAAAAA